MDGGSTFRWSSSLGDVFEDPGICAWGTFCPCILFGRNVHNITDGQIAFTRACLTHFFLGGCWGCGSLGYWWTCASCYAAPYRGKLRRRKELPEMPYSDLKTHIFCHPCALCQEYRQIKAGQSETVQGPTKPTVDRTPEATMDHLAAAQRMER